MSRENYFFSGIPDVAFYLMVYCVMPVGAVVYAGGCGKVDFLWSIFSIAVGVIYDCYGRYNGDKNCKINIYLWLVGITQAALAVFVVLALMRVAKGSTLSLGYVLPFALALVPAVNLGWQCYKFEVDRHSTNMAVNV